MTNKNKVIIFFAFILLNACSFDSKTGLWSDAEKEKKRISQLEQKQSQILETNKIYSSDNIFKKEIFLNKNITLSIPKRNTSWTIPVLNNQNYLGNIYLPTIENILLKKKIGKNKFSNSKNLSSLLIYRKNIIFSDDAGTIFNINQAGKINWKINVYDKIYKKIYKNLVFSIHKNNIYVADNIGFVYSMSLESGKILWVKNYGTPLKSTIKVFDKFIFLTDQDNRIICLDIHDGTKIWDILSISSFIKSQSLLSLAVSKNGELISINSAADIYKIQGMNGSINWSRNTSDSLFADATDFFKSSDIVLSGRNIIFSSGPSIQSYNFDTGDINWKEEVSSIATPIIDGKHIFIVTENGYFVILEKDTGNIISSNYIFKILK